MPYEFDWLDAERRIVAVRLHSPVQPTELEALHAELVSLAEAAEPAFILADIRNFDLMAAYSQLGDVIKTLSFPSLDESQMQRSRIAIVGGGPLVQVALSFAGDMLPEGELVKAFKHEDRAYTWLVEAAGAPSPGL